MSKESAVILSRVSSKAQEEEGYSLDAQTKLIKAYAETQGFEIERIFQIAETASAHQERKTFKELLKYIANRPITHLLVEKTDRLTRNLHDTVAISDWLEDNESRRLHFVKENQVLHKRSTSDQLFMWTIHVAVAKRYSDNLREEVFKGQKEKLAQGWLPGKPPRGYVTIGVKGKKEHIPDMQLKPIIQKMFSLYLRDGYSVNRLRNEMAKLGLSTRYGKPYSVNQIQNLLENPFYVGINRWMGVDYPGLQEPIIDRTTFEKVQAKLHRRNIPKYSKHNPTYKGVLTCQDCGGLVTWEKQKGNWYGHCNGYRNCPKKKWLREDKLESELLTYFESLVCPSEEIMEWVKKALHQKHLQELDSSSASVKLLRKEKDTLDRKLSIIYEDRLNERLSPEVYDQIHRRLLMEIKTVKENLENVDDSMERQFKHGMSILELSQSAASLYRQSDEEDKRIIISQLFSNLQIKGDAVSFTFTELAQAIADKAKLHRQLMKKFELSKDNEKTEAQIEKALDNTNACSIWLTLVDELSNYFEQSTEVEMLSTCCSSMLASISPPVALASE